MGTFHHGKGELHGITVLVDTNVGVTWIGRCDTVVDQGVLLVGADRHDADHADDRDAWVDKALRFGAWPRIERVLVPAAEVTSVRPLGDLASA